MRTVTTMTAGMNVTVSEATVLGITHPGFVIAHSMENASRAAHRTVPTLTKAFETKTVSQRGTL